MKSKEDILRNIENKPRKGIKCINHSSVQAAVYCENCGNPLCNNCVVINWRSNFINNIFMTSNDKFIEEIVCKDCAKKINKSQVILSCGLLFLVLSVVMAMIIGAV